MNAMCSVHHSCLYDITMIASWCVAVLSFLSLFVLMVVTKTDLKGRKITRSTAWRRFKFAAALASLTGLTASLPVALALGGHRVASVLVRELSYATAIAMGMLCFAAVLTRLVTTQPTGSGNFEYREWDQFEHSISHGINPASGLPKSGSLDPAGDSYDWISDSHEDLHRISPASGLPMNGSFDVAGNLYGWNSHSDEHHTWNH
jgi:hypothetical protein